MVPRYSRPGCRVHLSQRLGLCLRRREQRPRRHVQRLGKTIEVGQRHVPLQALNSRNVGAVQIALERQPLLRPALANPVQAQPVSQYLPQVVGIRQRSGRGELGRHTPSMTSCYLCIYGVCFTYRAMLPVTSLDVLGSLSWLVVKQQVCCEIHSVEMFWLSCGRSKHENQITPLVKTMLNINKSGISSWLDRIGAFVVNIIIFFAVAWYFLKRLHLADITLMDIITVWPDKHPWLFIYLLGSASALVLEALWVIFAVIFLWPLNLLVAWTTKANVVARNLKKIMPPDKQSSWHDRLVIFGFTIFSLLFGVALSWAGVLFQAGGILMHFWRQLSSIRDALTPKPEAIKSLMFPLRNNPDLSREAVWAYVIALDVKSGNGQPDEHDMLNSLNEIHEYCRCLDRQVALNFLNGLRVVDGNVIASALRHLKKKEAEPDVPDWPDDLDLDLDLLK